MLGKRLSFLTKSLSSDIHNAKTREDYGDSTLMPQISSFYGIKITMFYNDHPPPHFHVRYGKQKAIITIDSPNVWAGKIPAPQLRLVKEWAEKNKASLEKNWDLAREQKQLDLIDGLR